ncbi:hypothetical protein [Bradyrhizobium murdochi]|uniref:hypothetical protein n=1 Tax=Bradyrhizobium murdochi TaxID=1038859 RepID=UPI000422A98D|nr:hypothetical protein [Bradyrhizobium murdochi]
MTTVELTLRRGLRYEHVALGFAFTLLLCVSMVLVSRDVEAAHHIAFDSRAMLPAAFSVAAFSLCAYLMFSSNNAFSVAVSFYLFAITAGYLWLSFFTQLSYDHATARLSAVAMWAAFAIPALTINRSLKFRDFLTIKQMDLISVFLICASAVIALRGYFLGFHFVGFIEGDPLRNTLILPTWMRYAVPILTTAALPFCCAWLLFRKRYILALVALTVCLAYYPITLHKTALMTPIWLVFISILLKLVRWRVAVVLSLLIPLAIGLAALAVAPLYYTPIFRVINFRMLAIPASALDHYFHYFSTHPLTNFCQISIIGKLLNCSLPDQLGVLLAQEYKTGNYNASLLATEGIASVGPYVAPVSAFFCGLVFAAANLVSNRLNPSFVILSGAAMLPAIMNVPLSTVALTHGGIVLVILWMLTPSDAPR